MKKKFIILVLFLSMALTNDFMAQEAIDTATHQRFERLKINVKRYGWNAQKEAFIQDKWHSSNGNSYVYKLSLDKYLDPDLDFDDFCLLQQYMIVLELLLQNPIFINRLKISELEFKVMIGPKHVFAGKDMRIEIYSDPIVSVEVGVFKKTLMGSKIPYCKLVDQETLLSAFNSFKDVR
jgi:hypothetical protein